LQRSISSITGSPVGSPTARAKRSGLEPIRLAALDVLEERRRRVDRLVRHVRDRAHLVAVHALAHARDLADRLRARDPLPEVAGRLGVHLSSP
jgi:hypothetical protein